REHDELVTGEVERDVPQIVLTGAVDDETFGAHDDKCRGGGGHPRTPAYPLTMERDLRDTPLYKDVEDFYRRSLGPGLGRTSDVSNPRPSPDGRCIAFRGDQWERLEGHTLGRIGL